MVLLGEVSHFMESIDPRFIRCCAIHAIRVVRVWRVDFRRERASSMILRSLYNLLLPYFIR